MSGPILTEASCLDTAIKIAVDAHRGQFDKAGQPYILHPLRVMLATGSQDARIAAVLHDVIEDTPVTLRQLAEAGIGSRALAAIGAVTRREAESYEAFIDRIAEDDLAIEVKLADIDDNLNPARLARLGDTDQGRLRLKYEGPRAKLVAARQASVLQGPKS